MKRKKAEKIMREWQKRLKLMDWDIDLKYRHADEMDECAGMVERHHDHKIATIIVMDPKTVHGDYDYTYSLEHTIVHELIHLHTVGFDDFKEGGRKQTDLEIMINTTAKAFVDLREELELLRRLADVKQGVHRFVDADEVFKALEKKEGSTC